MKRHIGYGETHRVVGDHSSLGSWDLGRAVEMAWGEGDAWSGEASIPPGTSFEFKCVQTGSGDASWEGGKNHAVIIPQDAACATVEVVVDWGKGVAVTVQGGNGTSSTPAGDSTGQGEAYVEYSDGEAGSSSSSGNESSFISDDERLPGQAWAGPDTVFMRSNEHSQERQGVWNTEGLEGAALHLVAGDKKAGR